MSNDKDTLTGLSVTSDSTHGPSIGLDIDNSDGGIGAEVFVQAKPGQNAVGVSVVQNGPGTGLRVVQSGPGIGLKVVVNC